MKAALLAYRKNVLPMISENYEDLSKLRNSQFEQEDPYEYYALQYIRDTSTPGRFTAREVICHECFIEIQKR